MTNETKQKIKNEIKEWTKSLLFALAVGGLILLFARPSFIIGPSMEPTFHDKTVVLVEKISYITGEPQMGDIIVAKTGIELNSFMNKSVIKRVIGLSGDHILIKDGLVEINGKVIDENYIRDGFTNGTFEGTVPENHVFIMGDNRVNSNDSRYSEIGYVPIGDIKGKVYFRIFPFNEIASF
ncbi:MULTISPECIES: signal peptidase I [unclassified Fusibacter]|uniref:signal peptidase I n=1 Tax=unclassified Fusibacter TaxID=2624464 RepID=UPI00101033C7|nr:MULTISPECIES: signal peptidase I [unclassified Fusibacter]MCK8060981.1 signal peptidase I [Fusibacter sp. A2]NPE20565.1 signal peptidase I [Fusibacter sp. A1]RXV63762.1 signal peptidase I [Fusibacter sp. A1]